MHALLLLAMAAAPLTTVAEQSGWTKTGRIEEVERLCAAFPRRYPGKVKCERFGTTPMGRPMLALIASSDGTGKGADAKVYGTLNKIGLKQGSKTTSKGARAAKRK